MSLCLGNSAAQNGGTPEAVRRKNSFSTASIRVQLGFGKAHHNVMFTRNPMRFDQTMGTTSNGGDHLISRGLLHIKNEIHITTGPCIRRTCVRGMSPNLLKKAKSLTANIKHLLMDHIQEQTGHARCATKTENPC